MENVANNYNIKLQLLYIVMTDLITIKLQYVTIKNNIGTML